MQAIAKNYDVICLQMRNYLPHLESPIKKEVNKLLAEIRSVLVSGKKVKSGFDALLPSVFNFRIKAIKWLLEEDELDLVGLLDEVYPQLEELKQNPKLEILAENVLFALRCNKRVVKALVNPEDFSEENFTANSAQLPTVTYEQFLATLAFSVPNEEVAQKFVDWVNASLYIEVIVLSASIVNDENLKVSDKTINELAFLIADAAQEYSAVATELGILKPRSQRQPTLTGALNRDFLREQKFIAELGINDFAKYF